MSTAIDWDSITKRRRTILEVLQKDLLSAEEILNKVTSRGIKANIANIRDDLQSLRKSRNKATQTAVAFRKRGRGPGMVNFWGLRSNVDEPLPLMTRKASRKQKRRQSVEEFFGMLDEPEGSQTENNSEVRPQRVEPKAKAPDTPPPTTVYAANVACSHLFFQADKFLPSWQRFLAKPDLTAEDVRDLVTLALSRIGL